jgi:hypothetical protein
MRFLNSWTITLEKLPGYSNFNKKFKIRLDKCLMDKMYKSLSIEEYNIKNRKALLKNVINCMKDDFLEVSYYHPYSLGRYYPTNSISPICISRHMKHTIFHSLGWVDLDMIAGHSTILYEIAKLNNRDKEFTNIKNYIDNKPTLLKTLHSYYTCSISTLTEDNVKDIFNIGIYGGGHNTWLEQMKKDGILLGTNIPHPLVNQFLTECKTFMDVIYFNNPEIVSKVKGKLDIEKDLYELKSRVMSYWCGTIENHIISIVYKYLIKRNVINEENIVLEYDGVCLKLNNNNETFMEELLSEINDLILTETRLSVKMKWKGYRDEHIHLNELGNETDTDDISIDSNDDNIDINDTSFEAIKKTFELTHCKIINKTFFLTEFENKVIPMIKNQLSVSYEHLHYRELVFNKKTNNNDEVKKQFIYDWFKCEDIKTYNDVGVYPPGLKCPNDYYNMWKPFDMELVKTYIKNQDAIDKIKNHILILCGNDESVCDYFIKWIAQMIQYPAIKTVCPTLISKEGAGKGTLLQLLTKMLGSNKVFETTQPSRDVWGEFNGLMTEAFLVNLDELGKKETMESDGRIKGLITNPTLKINNKGVAQFPISSFHRFIITTNNEDPIKTTKDDRRKFIIRSSDELIGNKAYFDGIYKIIDDIDSVKSIYEYFKSIPDMDKFNKIPMPVTEYQNDLKELSVSPIESWVKDYVLDNYYETEPIKLLGMEQYKLFCDWVKKCGMEYTVTLIAFAVRLKNLNLPGITKCTSSNKGERRSFDITILKTHFNLNNIEIEPNENE